VGPFSKIPDIDRFAIGVATPVGKADVIKILGAWADARGGVTGFSAPVNVDAVERDFSIEYAIALTVSSPWAPRRRTWALSRTTP